MTILFKFTSRSRPDRFIQSLRSVLDNVSSNDFKVLVSLDLDDTSMNSIVREVFSLYPQHKERIIIVYGHSTGKINAINRDMELAGNYDILINMSDDMFFNVNGFDDMIREDFKAFSKDGYLAIHYPDGYANERLITLSIMSKKVYDFFGYIYHPGYISLWCDNEFMDAVKIKGWYIYSDRKLYKHEHPLHNGNRHIMDELYQKNESYFNTDKEFYFKRKAVNFGL